MIAAAMGVQARRQSPAPPEWRTTALAAFDDVWQTVNDTFYDPTFGGLDWAGVKAELRPRAETASTADGIRDVIRQMLARLGRSHFSLISRSAVTEFLPGSATLPVEIRIAGGRVVITRVFTEPASDGLRPGDAILSIDDQSARDWLAAAPGRDARAGAVDAWRKAYRALHGEPGSRAVVAVRDPAGRERRVTVVRRLEPGQMVTLGNLPPLRVHVESAARTTPAGRDVGLIAFTVWMAAVNDPVADAIDRFRSADGVIFDLRGNPGGLADMMRGIAGHVMAEPALLGRMQMRTLQLKFDANPRRSTREGRRVEPFSGPVAILVDELTASASECFAGALQSIGRARVFGRQTMGQALPASTKGLPNGDVLLHAIGDFVTATGRSLEGEGVIPDEVVALSPERLAAGGDPVIEAALRWVDRTGAAKSPNPE
jgi:carboxyl-terminal processing protease